MYIETTGKVCKFYLHMSMRAMYDSVGKLNIFLLFTLKNIYREIGVQVNSVIVL